MCRPQDNVTSSFKKELDSIIQTDPLSKLTMVHMELLWKFRSYCSSIPEALPKLLRCVRWGDLNMVTEVHRLLKVWRPITLEVALELLDYHFADEKVRSLAVRRLEKLSNDELQSFLLQLVQVRGKEKREREGRGREGGGWKRGRERGEGEGMRELVPCPRLFAGAEV